MKKQICGLLAAALLSTQASAAVVDFQIGETGFSIYAENAVTEKTLEAAPFVNDAWRTMVPLRAISEAFGAEVEWNADSRTAYVRNGETEIALTIDSTTALVGGEAVEMDCAPVIVADRTFVPLRFVGEALACNVNYAASSRHIVIDNTAVAMQCGDRMFTFAELDALYSLLLQWNTADAAAAGIDTATLQTLCLESALESAYNITMLENAFPDASISAEDLVNLHQSAIEESEIVSLPLEGMRDILYEKIYFSQGIPALTHIMTTTDTRAIYNEDYICAKHILVEDEETAKSVYEKAMAGEDFDALIAAHGTDPGMEQNPGGYVFTKGEMVVEFEAAAFAAKEGEITAPVQTGYGFHIIQRLPLPAYSDIYGQQIINRIVTEKLQNVPAPAQRIQTETLSEMLGITQ